MRLFAPKGTSRALVINARDPTVELPVISAESRMLLDYDRIQKSALANERRSINQHDCK
jgi:hypothetical protein